MRQMLLASLAVATLLLFGMRVSPADADWPAADLSTSLLFNCLPDGTVRVGLKWASSYQGAQWVDLSVYNNDFTGGAQSIGPLSPSQSAVSWDGLPQGVWHFVRVNTLTPGGWAPSRPMAFLTPPDCRFSTAGTAYYPPAPPPECINLSSAGFVAGCVWTERDDYLGYRLGEPVVYCYSVSQPMNVRIVAFRPDGSTVVVADRFDSGTGACIGPYQAGYPVGLRTVSMFGGPYFQLLSQTHFYVR